MILSKSKISKYFIYMSIVLLIISELAASLNDANIVYSTQFKVMILALSSLFILVNFNVVKNENNVLLLYIPIMIYTILLIPFSTYPNIAFKNELKWLFSIAIGYSFYILKVRSSIDMDFIKKMTFILVIGISVASLLYQSLNQSHLVQSNYGYTLLALVPLILYAYNDNPKYKMILIVLLGLFILLSFKRGSILIYMSIFMLVIVPYLIKIKNLKINLIFILTLLIAISLFIMNDNFINILLQRLEDTSGSGRTGTYLLFLDGIYNKDMLEIIFGSGPLSSQEFSKVHMGTRVFNAKLGLMTHSDGLLIMFEYGLVGIILYLLIIKNLFFKIRYKLINASMAINSLLIIYILTFIFSHIFFTNGSWLLFVTLGLIAADIKIKERTKSVT